MRSTFTLLLLICCAYVAQAQTNPSGNTGVGSDVGNSYSNGAIPNPNEQTQNRPDSSLRSQDTTYMQQQWNDGAAQKKQTNKRSTTQSTHQTTTTTNKKKK